jgi:hypothetical protein
VIRILCFVGCLLQLAAPIVVMRAGANSVPATISAFAATSPQIKLSLESGSPGTPVTVTGNDFPPSERVALYMDSPGPYLAQPGPVADASGSFVQGITVPTKDAGAHQICGDTAYPGSNQPVAAKACATFTVLAGTSASATPTLISQPASSPSFPVPAVLAALAVLLVLVGAIAFLTRKAPPP